MERLRKKTSEIIACREGTPEACDDVHMLQHGYLGLEQLIEYDRFNPMAIDELRKRTDFIRGMCPAHHQINNKLERYDNVSRVQSLPCVQLMVALAQETGTDYQNSEIYGPLVREAHNQYVRQINQLLQGEKHEV